MADTFRTIAQFGPAGAGGATLRLSLQPQPGSYLLMQDDNNQAALFLGFGTAQGIEASHQREGAWRPLGLLPLPPARGGMLDLTLRFDTDHAILTLADRPWAVLPLGAPATQIVLGLTSAPCDAPILQRGSEAGIGIGAFSQCIPESLTWLHLGLRRALVAAPCMAAATADALAAYDQVVALAPTPWAQAELAFYFAAEIAAGRLLPLAVCVAPFDGTRSVRPAEAWDDEGGAPALAPLGGGALSLHGVTAARLLAALGPLAMLYLGARRGETAAWQDALVAGAERLVRVVPLSVAEALLETGCRDASLRRCLPVGPVTGVRRWIAPALLRTLSAAAESDDFVLLGEVAPDTLRCFHAVSASQPPVWDLPIRSR